MALVDLLVEFGAFPVEMTQRHPKPLIEAIRKAILGRRLVTPYGTLRRYSEWVLY